VSAVNATPTRQLLAVASFVEKLSSKNEIFDDKGSSRTAFLEGKIDTGSFFGNQVGFLQRFRRLVILELPVGRFLSALFCFRKGMAAARKRLEFLNAGRSKWIITNALHGKTFRVKELISQTELNAIANSRGEACQVADRDLIRKILTGDSPGQLLPVANISDSDIVAMYWSAKNMARESSFGNELMRNFPGVKIIVEKEEFTPNMGESKAGFIRRVVERIAAVNGQNIDKTVNCVATMLETCNEYLFSASIINEMSNKFCGGMHLYLSNSRKSKRDGELSIIAIGDGKITIQQPISISEDATMSLIDDGDKTKDIIIAKGAKAEGLTITYSANYADRSWDTPLHIDLELSDSNISFQNFRIVGQCR
jgi:hypothetical protein